MEIFIARTQGFCAGVASAIDIVELALEKYGAPLYVYHDIVHNTAVVNDFKNRGVVFVETLDDLNEGDRIIFSAHGIPPEVLQKAKDKKLNFVDATCPLVTKVHNEATKFSGEDIHTILIGHRGHQELIGTSGYVKPSLLHVVEDEEDIKNLTIPKEAPVAYITQTTLSVDDTAGLINMLRQKYVNLIGPKRSDICYATQNRQDSIKELTSHCDCIVICGSPHSSNSNRLRETGAKAGIDSYIVDTADELDVTLLKDKKRIGISSGASVPRYLVDEIIKKITDHHDVINVHEFDNPEKNIVFKLPAI